jgi:hypothetical protein
MTINEIARCLPTDVKNQKSKQTRLLRFIDNRLPQNDMMFFWARFVLTKAYSKCDDNIIILVDGVNLMYDYKAYVAAISFRKRAIPNAFFPIPQFTFHFWGPNLLDRLPASSVVKLVLSGLILIFAILILRRSPTALLTYRSRTIALLAFFYTKY